MGKQPSQEDVLSYFDKLSNWGRWGEEDTLGTLNLLTPEKRKQAGALIREGVSVSLSKRIPRHGPMQEIFGAMPLSHMIQSGERYALGDNPENPAFPGVKPIEWAAESLTFVFHGGIFTHIDDLGHVFYDGKMYNGRSSALVKAAEGATVQNSEVLKDGIVTRGILYDIPRLTSANAIDPENIVSPEELEEFEQKHGVRAEPGDVLFVRTGYAGQVDALAPGEAPPTGHSGWGTACLPWLLERGAAVIGSDVATDASTHGYTKTALPVHQVALVALGLRLIDNAHLERLAETCAQLNRWEFCLSVNPLWLENGTGSPVNPIATF